MSDCLLTAWIEILLYMCALMNLEVTKGNLALFWIHNEGMI